MEHYSTFSEICRKAPDSGTFFDRVYFCEHLPCFSLFGLGSSILPRFSEHKARHFYLFFFFFWVICEGKKKSVPRCEELSRKSERKHADSNLWAVCFCGLQKRTVWLRLSLSKTLPGSNGCKTKAQMQREPPSLRVKSVSLFSWAALRAVWSGSLPASGALRPGRTAGSSGSPPGQSSSLDLVFGWFPAEPRVQWL